MIRLYCVVIKIVATRCHILQLKCVKFEFGQDSAQDPAVGAYSAPPDPLAGFKGAYFYGKEGGEVKENGEERKGLDIICSLFRFK